MIENHRFAETAAKEAVEKAETAEKVAVEKAQREAKAKLVAEIAARVENRGPVFAAAIASLGEEFAGLEDDLQALRDLDAPTSPKRLVAISFGDFVSHTLRGAGLVVGDMVPPGRRFTALALTQGHSTRAREWAASVLGEGKAAA